MVSGVQSTLRSACTIARQTPDFEDVTDVTDRLRKQIQQHLDQLVGEADRLRKALAALDPRSPSAPARKAPARRHAQATATTSRAAATTSARARQTRPATARSPRRTAPGATKAPTRQTGPAAAASPRRTAPGATKAAVLAALAGSEPITASQVADKAGLSRPTVSTTLSRLAKTGEVQKAQRGYRLAPASGE
jgi:CRP-like cAMP-binding protein